MNCKEIKPLLSEFLDGELDAVVISEIRSHIDACKECRRELRELEAIVDLLHSVRDITPPVDLAGNVRALITAETEPSPGVRLWQFLSTAQFRVAAAACLVLGICTYGLLHISGRAPESEHVPASVHTRPKMQSGGPAQPGKIKDNGAKDVHISSEIMAGEEVGGAKLEKSVSRDRAVAVPRQNAKPYDDLVQTGKKKNSAKLAYAAKPSPPPSEAADSVAMPSTVLSDSRMKRAEELPVAVAESGPRTGLYDGDTYRELEKKDSERHSTAGIVHAGVSSRKVQGSGFAGRTFRQITLVTTNDSATGRAQLLHVATRHSVSSRDGSVGKTSLSDVNSNIRIIQIRKIDYTALITDLQRLGNVTDMPVIRVSEPDSGKDLLNAKGSDDSHMTQIEIEVVP